MKKVNEYHTSLSLHKKDLTEIDNVMDTIYSIDEKFTDNIQEGMTISYVKMNKRLRCEIDNIVHQLEAIQNKKKEPKLEEHPYIL